MEFTAIPVKYLSQTNYTVRDDKKKIVLVRPIYWFLMEYKSGSPRKKNKEVGKVGWAPLFVVRVKLFFYSNERRSAIRAVQIN